MTYEAFVYVWTNIENNMYYIGKHKGLDNDGYISSGKHFLTAYNADPSLFKREIVFRGTHDEVRREESRRIEEAIQNSGYERIYNLTSWNHLKSWKRTCLHCGAICCPDNEQWAEAFERIHFTNCYKLSKPPERDVSVKKISRLERKHLNRKQERILWWKNYDQRIKSDLQDRK